MKNSPAVRILTALILVGAGVLALVSRSGAAGPPPPPTAVNGHPVVTVATGLKTPTSFAFDTTTGTTFIGAFGDEQTGAGGGVLAVTAAHPAAAIPGIPSGISGLIFHDGTLYVSAASEKGGKIVAYKGWNGTQFTSYKTIFNARRTVGVVNGIAWGPDGRIYGGAGLVNDVNSKGKVKKSPFPDPYTVFSIKPSGKGFKVVSRGLRQPWQMTFVGSRRNPYVSVLSQDSGKVPKDAIVVAKKGADFGFPDCFDGTGIACRHAHFAKPLITFPRHASPMGIQAVGKTLYVALFGGLGKGPEVVSVPAKKGGKPTPFLTGYAAPVVALGLNGSTLYTGDVTGTVYSVGL